MTEEKSARIERRVLCSLSKDVLDTLENTNATLGEQDHFNRGFTQVAKHLGVQPKDLHVIGEFEVTDDGETFIRAFPGIPDPSPNRTGAVTFLSLQEALDATW